MIFFQFLLFTPILVSAVDLFIKDRTLAGREDTYDIAQGDLLFGTDYTTADLFDSNTDPNNSDHALPLDGTSSLGYSNFITSDCSPQSAGKLRSREQCDNPLAPKLEIPSIDTAGSAAIELKQPCEDGEDRLCCAGNEVAFDYGFRAIVPDCAKC